MNSSPVSCRRRLALAALAASFALPTLGHAQDPYPNKPVRVIVPFPAGTSPDVIARVWSDKMRQLLGQPFIVDNRPGAATIIGAQAVAAAAADGYTLLYTAQNTLSINPYVYRQLPYRADDFLPVSHVTTVPLVMIVAASSPVKNLSDLVRAAKDNPRKFNYASYGVGQGTHVAMQRFANAAGIHMVHVPYRDGGINDVMNGTVSVSFEASTTAIPQIQGGRARALAVSSSKRLESLPDVPAVAELVPGFFGDSWHGVFLRKGAPAEAINRIAEASQKVIAMEDFRKRLRDSGLQPAGGSPPEFARFLAEDGSAWAKVVRDNQIAVD